jgi:hypothetical protein
MNNAVCWTEHFQRPLLAYRPHTASFFSVPQKVEPLRQKSETLLPVSQAHRNDKCTAQTHYKHNLPRLQQIDSATIISMFKPTTNLFSFSSIRPVQQSVIHSVMLFPAPKFHVWDTYWHVCSFMVPIREVKCKKCKKTLAQISGHYSSIYINSSQNCK